MALILNGNHKRLLHNQSVDLLCKNDNEIFAFLFHNRIMQCCDTNFNSFVEMKTMV